MDGRETARARAFLEACGRAQIPCELSKDVLRTLWGKYVYLVAHSGMTALTRCPAGVLRALPETRQLYRRLLEEMSALARAAGADLGPGIVETCLGYLDALQGYAVRLGERHGIATPMLFVVYAALRPYLDGPPGAIKA
jgi:2-dehydropantoate 2-reductase